MDPIHVVCTAALGTIALAVLPARRLPLKSWAVALVSAGTAIAYTAMTFTTGAVVVRVVSCAIAVGLAYVLWTPGIMSAPTGLLWAASTAWAGPAALLYPIGAWLLAFAWLFATAPRMTIRNATGAALMLRTARDVGGVAAMKGRSVRLEIPMVVVAAVMAVLAWT